MLIYVSVIKCNIKNTAYGLGGKNREGGQSDVDNDSAGDVRIICLQIWYNIIYLPHNAAQEMKSEK